MKKIINTNNAPAAIGPYSQANMANGVLYISGQIPVDPATGKLEEGIEKSTHQVMKNLEAILTEAGLGFRHVVKATIFLKNMDDFAVMNDIYASYLDAEAFPARETVQVSCLPKNVDIEISMIAHAD
ncbi:RidA family protein [Chryseobacterium sp. POL2]|uniref:RidA family protein n=1 Tax=Chryseobacterium sp. POL2 TaxID=2713414 RepID=UPI0013E18598|nr:RidA family protein [Chryseobacterium sp. POL2]QIG89641.1 RidA family protein [Chryseobacterium sp. POL2]